MRKYVRGVENHVGGTVKRVRLVVVAALVSCAPRTGSAQTVTEQVGALATDGDVILHKSQSSQAAALRAATGSEYTHVGIVFHHDGELQVLEAVEPVRWTPLGDWIQRGAHQHVVLMRVNGLSPEAADTVRAAATAYIGVGYDLLFEWSDERIYCSELVYKAFQSATGREIGERETLRDLDLSSEAVRRLIDARTGGDVDLAEPVVTPLSILNDGELTVVFANDPNVRSD